MSSVDQPDMSHFLITIKTVGGHMHCYCAYSGNCEEATKAAMHLMLSILEKEQIAFFPAILKTQLKDDISLVQSIVSGLSAEVGNCIRTMTTQHISIFSLSNKHPDNKRLNRIH